MDSSILEHFRYKYRVVLCSEQAHNLRPGDTYTISCNNITFPVNNVRGFVMPEEDIIRLLKDMELFNVENDPEAVKLALEHFLTLKALCKNGQLV